MSLGAWCPECGPVEKVDEDGCCLTCGKDAMGPGANRAILALQSEERLSAVLVAVNDLVFRLKRAIRFIGVPKEHPNANAWKQKALKLLDGRSGPKWWNGDMSR